MTVESDDLTILRETTSKTLLALLWLHVPIAMLSAVARHGWLMPTAVGAVWSAGRDPVVAHLGNGLSTRLIFAVAPMGSVCRCLPSNSPATLGRSTCTCISWPLACLLAYCDYRPILAGAVAVALHHLVLNFLPPAAVYPGGADFGRVVLHAVILLIEAAC